MLITIDRLTDRGTTAQSFHHLIATDGLVNLTTFDTEDLDMKELIVPAGMEIFHSHYHFAPAIRANGLLFLSGQLGLADLQTPTLADGLAAQIDCALQNIGKVLNTAGRDYSAVVEISSFHVGSLGDHMPLFVDALARFFGDPYPAWTSVEVSGLALPGALVEIKAIALA